MVTPENAAVAAAKEQAEAGAAVYLLEFVDEHGAASQQEAFASLAGAMAALDPDVQWTDCSDDRGRYWCGAVPGDRAVEWWITELEVKP